MVKIRLKRMGTKKRPVYRLVVADARSPRDGRFIESVGFYDPLPSPAKVEIDVDKVREWIRKGARPSDSARDLLVAQGVLPGRGGKTAAVAVAEPEPAAAAPETVEVEIAPAAAADTDVSADAEGEATPAANGSAGPGAEEE